MEGTPTCRQCGAPVGSGRFCTNCGAAIEPVPQQPAYDDTQERFSAVPEETPPEDSPARQPEPSALPPAEPPRQAPPLFRDEVYPRTPPPPAPVATGAPPPVYAEPTTHRRSSSAVLWIAAVVGLLTVLVIGAVLLFSGGGEDTPSAASSPNQKTHHTASAPASSSGSPSAASSATAGASGSPTEVAGLSTASAPAHAPAGVDFSGQTVTYVAPNMVDGVVDTCWRTPGDATGMVLTFRLDQPTTITKVGLINGYAKTAVSGGRTYNWYLGDRRVLAVTWVFDNGSTVSQQFTQTPTMQSRKVPPVTTASVQVRITSVSAPGRGPAARNDTAISEVSLIGRAS